MAIIAASILDADFAKLRDEVVSVDKAGVDTFTLDVMDGVFVPRISFGSYLVARVREWTDLAINIHLMTVEPINQIEKMYDAGADSITFHLEATTDPLGVIDAIKSYGLLVGLAIHVETPVAKLFEFLPYIDLVNLMSVRTGFGGLSFDAEVLQKIRDLAKEIAASKTNVAIMVDGGVKVNNIRDIASAGADILVVGTGIYHTSNYEESISELKTQSMDQPFPDVRDRFADLLTPRNLAKNRTDDQIARLRSLRDSFDIDPDTWDPRTVDNGELNS
jgi:ribulose-phosphate 3-epimerase